jgi:hypothetical protein
MLTFNGAAVTGLVEIFVPPDLEEPSYDKLAVQVDPDESSEPPPKLQAGDIIAVKGPIFPYDKFTPALIVATDPSNEDHPFKLHDTLIPSSADCVWGEADVSVSEGEAVWGRQWMLDDDDIEVVPSKLTKQKELLGREELKCIGAFSLGERLEKVARSLTEKREQQGLPSDMLDRCGVTTTNNFKAAVKNKRGKTAVGKSRGARELTRSVSGEPARAKRRRVVKVPYSPNN